MHFSLLVYCLVVAENSFNTSASVCLSLGSWKAFRTNMVGKIFLSRQTNWVVPRSLRRKSGSIYSTYFVLLLTVSWIPTTSCCISKTKLLNKFKNLTNQLNLWTHLYRVFFMTCIGLTFKLTIVIQSTSNSITSLMKLNFDKTGRRWNLLN